MSFLDSGQSAPAADKLAPPPSLDTVLAGNKEREDRFNKQAGEVEGRIESAQKALENLKPPPEMQQVPPPEPTETDPKKIWGSTAMLLAAIGSAFTRRPLVTAMQSAAKVINGYRQNDLEASNTAFQSWKVATDNAIKAQDFQVKSYQQALETAKDDIAAGSAEMRALASQFQDENMLRAAEARDYEAMQRLYTEQLRLKGQLDKAGPALELQNALATTQLEAAREIQSGPGTPQEKAEKIKQLVAKGKEITPKSLLENQVADEQLEQINAIPKDTPASERFSQIMRIVKPTAAGAGFTDEMGALMGALAERGVSLPTGMRSQAQQAELYKGLLERNPGKTPDQIADMIKTGQIELAAQKKETGVAAGIAGKVEVAANEIDQFIPLVEDASSKVQRDKFVPVNRLLQMSEAQLSDPNLRALKIRINSLLNAYDLLAARGGTDVAKREEVRNLLTSADSPDVLKTALQSFKLESDAAHRAAVAATKVPELANQPSGGIPDSARKQLKEGVTTTFGNGQRWTLQDGNPVQVQ